jgi:hypothetical protein
MASLGRGRDTDLATEIEGLNARLSRCARAGQRMRAVIPVFDLT